MAESKRRAFPIPSRESGSAFGGVDGHAAGSCGLAALGGVVGAVSPAGVRKAAAGVGHGAAHLLLLVADARKVPGTRAVQEQGGEDEEQGDAVALARSTSSSEENDSSHCSVV